MHAGRSMLQRLQGAAACHAESAINEAIVTSSQCYWHATRRAVIPRHSVAGTRLTLYSFGRWPKVYYGRSRSLVEPWLAETEAAAKLTFDPASVPKS